MNTMTIHEDDMFAENPFMKFCGVLTKEEAEELLAAVAKQRVIDPEMWK